MASLIWDKLSSESQAFHAAKVKVELVVVKSSSVVAHQLIHAPRPVGPAQQSPLCTSRSWSAATGKDEFLTWPAYKGSNCSG